MQAPTFHVRTPDGRVWGPLTEAQVRESIRAGGLTPNSFVTVSYAEAWIPMWQHPVFGPAARASAPPAAAPGTAPRREASAGKIIAVVLGMTVLVLGLCAIPVVYIFNQGRSSIRTLLQESAKPQTLTADEGLDADLLKYKLTFPAGWRKDSSLNDEANIQASGHFRSAFVVAISEPKSDFDAGTTLQGYSDLTRPPLLSGLERGAFDSAPQRLTVGGHPALRYEIRGMSDGTYVLMLHNVIETRRNFHQVLLWTAANEFPPRRAELEQILQTFREP